MSDNTNKLSESERQELITNLYLEEHPLKSTIDIFQQSRLCVQLYFEGWERNPLDIGTFHRIGINVVNELLTDKWLMFLDKVFNDLKLKEFTEKFSEDFYNLLCKRVKEQIIKNYTSNCRPSK